jgi:filamentous hemagglutinin
MVNSDVVLVAGQRDQVSGMELGGAIRATGEYRGSLDLSSPGVIELGGDIGLEGFEIGSLTLRSVDRMNFISGNRAIRAMGDVTLASADGGLFELNMDGDLLIEAGNDITFGDGLTLQGNQSLTATAGGLLTNRAVTDVAGDLSFSGGTIDNTRALTSGGDMSLTATAGALNADVALTSGGFIALEGRDGVQSSVALTTTGGDITVHSLEGGITTTAAIDSSGVVELVAALDINSTASINASGSRGTTDESIIMTSDGAITLGDAVTSTGGDVLIDAGTSLQVAHVQGGNVSLAAGTTASIASVIAQSTATVIAQGELLVQDMQALDATLTGNTVALTGTLSATSANVSGLDVTLAGTVDIVDALDVQASGDLRLEGVTTAGTMSLRADGTAILDGALLHSTQTGFMGGDSLLLQATDMRVLGNTSMVADGGLLTITGTSSNGSYSATDMTLEGGDLSVVTELDALRFIANVDGAHDLSLSANAVLYLGGDLGSTDALANITLNGVDGLQLGGAVPLSSDALDVNVIAAVQTVVLQENHADLILDGVATILGFSEALSVTASEGDIRLGNNQSFVQLGDLSMTAGGDILVTDVTTEGNLHMTAHQVLVHQRDPMIILVSDGTGLVSTQASIVAGGNLIIDATTVGTSGGLGETALFGALGGVTGAPEGQIGVSAHFDREDLMLSGPAGTTQLLLRWLQQSVGDDSTLIAAESQSTPAEPVFEIEASNEEALTTETLSELGIIVRALDVEHVDAMRQGRPGQLTVDLVSGPGPAQVGRVVVTRHRLLRSQVHQAVARWRAAWAHDRATQAGGGMSWAHASTEAQAGSSGDQAAFARLKVGIAETYRHLALSGLTPSELQASKTFVANDLISRGAGAAAVGHLLN